MCALVPQDATTPLVTTRIFSDGSLTSGPAERERERYGNPPFYSCKNSADSAPRSFSLSDGLTDSPAIDQLWQHDLWRLRRRRGGELTTRLWRETNQRVNKGESSPTSWGTSFYHRHHIRHVPYKLAQVWVVSIIRSVRLMLGSTHS